jgi:DNA-binding NarL/FixJ family response regulator
MRILIADDDVEISAAMQLDLASYGFIADTVCAECEFVHALIQEEYTAVLLDIGLSNQDGIALVAAMRLRGDTTPVVLMSATQSAAELVRGLDEGADDYIAKPFNIDEVCARLRAVVRRKVPCDVPADSAVAKMPSGNLSSARNALAGTLNAAMIALTVRQKQVLELIAQGCQNKHIARELNIAERTVKMHITALLELVGAKNRTHLLVLAGERGLL